MADEEHAPPGLHICSDEPLTDEETRVMTDFIKTVAAEKVSEALEGVPPTWANVAISGRRVLKGEPLSMEVEGGFHTKLAPCDGTLYRLSCREPREVFVPKTVERGGTFKLPPIPKHRP